MKATEWNIKSGHYLINGKEIFVLQNMKTYNLDFCKKHSLERGQQQQRYDSHDNIFEFANIS